MSKRLTFLSAAALSLALALPAVAEDSPSADTVVATVNGTDIKLGHIIQTRANLPAQYQQLPVNVLLPGILDQLIQQIVLQQSVQGDTPASVAFALENQERSLMANIALEEVVGAAVTPETLQAAYDEAYGNVVPTMEYNASHILVESQQAAQQLTEEARGGADFAELAKTHSTGPSGPNGGSLGWFGAGMMVAPFEQATAALEAGQISDPVETQFGWHVIRLNETREKPKPSLEEVLPELQGTLQQQAVQNRISELTGSASIDRAAADALDPNVLNTIKVDGQ